MEDSQMNATTNETSLAGFVDTNVATESTEGARFSQNSLLSELPGLVFCLLTLGYVVTSLLAFS
jgi:hypothetical protein